MRGYKSSRDLLNHIPIDKGLRSVSFVTQCISLEIHGIQTQDVTVTVTVTVTVMVNLLDN